MNCFMCEIACGRGGVEWYDCALAASDYAVVIPALGAIAPGHVLVIPPHHVHSAQLLAPRARSGFARALVQTAGWLAERTGRPITAFEHGAAVAGSGPRSACSEHAHVQLLPGRYDQTGALSGGRRFSSLEAFYGVKPPFDPYLMIQDPGEDVLAVPDVGVSQYFRRVILAELGEPDDWDYWLFPRRENVRATLGIFGAGQDGFELSG
jgi:diadenosine tetraphosphate (Ap4A) HIT family hydrolase